MSRAWLCFLAAACASVLGSGGAACTSTSSSGAAGGGDASEEPEASGDAPLMLVQNPWDASRADVAIALNLLTTQMGMTVTFTEDDEYSQWPKIASGQYSACMEVWPSGHQADITEYIDTNKVENGGLLGPVGKISWYVPTYLLTAHPELASWQAYSNPATAQLFATAQTSPLGQFTNGDPTWTSYDSDIITNLMLDLKEVYLGSEAAELAFLDPIYNSRGYILMYLWTPDAALARYDLTAVQLPPYSAACYASVPDGGAGVDCDYPADHLFKIFYPGLAAANPRAYQFLESFSYTTTDQINILAQVDSQMNAGLTDQAAVTAAAQWWIDNNTATWKTWIPQ